MIRSHRSSVWQPPTDLFELGDHLVVRVEIAGMQTADFDISLENRRLRIAGVRTSKLEPLAYHQMEIGFGEFSIELELPQSVDADRVEAEYRQGFLQITMQKASSRRVPVQETSGRQERTE